MEMQQLRYFLAVVKHGNFRRASEELNITQSTLSRSIKKLEESLGAQLLERGPKGVIATIFGETLQRHAQVVIQETYRASDEIRAIQGLVKGQVRIGITPNYGRYVIPNVLASIRAELPEIDVSVTSAFYDDLMARLRRAELDFVFGMFSLSPSEPDLSFKGLLLNYSYVYARRDHPLANKKKVTLDQLSQHSWVMPDDSGVEEFLKKYFHNNGHRMPRQVFKSNSLSFIREAIVSADLLSIIPEHFAQEDVDRGLIVRLDHDEIFFLAMSGLIHRTTGSRPPAANAIAKLFEQECGRIIANEGNKLDPTSLQTD